MEEKHVLKLLKELREAIGYSQEVVAERLGVTHSTYSKTERGVVKLTFHTFFKILEALKQKPEEIFAALGADGFGAFTLDEKQDYDNDKLHNQNRLLQATIEELLAKVKRLETEIDIMKSDSKIDLRRIQDLEQEIEGDKIGRSMGH